MALIIKPVTTPSPAPATPPLDLRVTVFKNARGRLSKEFYLDDGQLQKTGSTHLSRGEQSTWWLPFGGDATRALTALKRHLDDLGSDEAITLGQPKDGRESGPVASVKRARGDDLTRTRENFVFAKGPGLILGDNDEGTGTLAILESLWPPFKNVAVLTRASASAGLYEVNSGRTFNSTGGEHLYFVADDQSQTEAVLKGWQRLALMKDRGQLKLSRSGGTLVRGPLDTAVGTPERLTYEGQAVVQHPVAQAPRVCTVRPGGVFDTQAFLAFVEREAPQEIVDERIRKRESDPDFQKRKADMRRQWEADYISRRIQEGATRERAQTEIQNLHRQVLLGSSEFETKDGKRIRIGDILFEPDTYIGLTGPDPIEGREYGSTTARVMSATALFSFAHGGILYTLKHDVGSINAAFDTYFAARDEAALRLFVAALSRADTTQVEAEALRKRAVEAFGVSLSAIKADIKKAQAEARAQAHEPAHRDSRQLIRYIPSEPALAINTVTQHLATLRSPVIYDHGGRLSIVVSREIKDSPMRRWSIRTVDRAIAMLRLNRTFVFRTGGSEPRDVAPPDAVIDGLLANDPPRMPPLVAIQPTPPVGPNGEIELQAGYHNGVFYDGSCGALEIPDHPTLDDAKAAWEQVKRVVLIEFPFDTPVDEAVVLALLITLMTRLDYPLAPAFLINAPTTGTGKSLLAATLIQLVTGTDAGTTNYDSGKGEELDKTLTSLFAEGAAIIYCDNVTGTLNSKILDEAMTAPSWKRRLLGGNQVFNERPRVTFVFTTNNATVTGETARRFLKSQLNARGYEDPTQRPILNEDLHGTIDAHRPQLIAGLLTIIRWHRQNGQPGVCKLASFEGWARHVGRLVQALTGQDPVASQAAIKRTDQSTAAETQFYAHWETWYGGQPVTAGRIFHDWKLALDPRFISDFPDFAELHEMVEGVVGKRLTARSFGIRLQKLTDRQRNGRILTQQGRDSHKNVMLFQLVTADADKPINPKPRIDVTQPPQPPPRVF